MTGGVAPLPPPAPPAIVWNTDHQTGAANFATHLDSAMSDFLGVPAGSTDPTGTGAFAVPRMASQLSPDLLLAAFMKLQISDPNNNVQTHDLLSTLMSDLRKTALTAQQAQETAAIKQMQEAQKSADHAATFGMIAMVVAIIVLMS